jgi:hypothetical protein
MKTIEKSKKQIRIDKKEQQERMKKHRDKRIKLEMELILIAFKKILYN